MCEICVLYEVARKIVRKVKRMPKRFINLAKNNIGNKFIYIINGISSDDFKNVEKKWKVYVPLNYSDLAEYSI